MEQQHIYVLNTNEIEGLADPCLEQYEFSLYKEKGKGLAKGSSHAFGGQKDKFKIALKPVSSIMGSQIPFPSLPLAITIIRHPTPLTKKPFPQKRA